MKRPPTQSGHREVPKSQWPRKGTRIPLRAEVALRRSGYPGFRVWVHDASPYGCRLEFLDLPNIGDRLLVRFNGLEALPAIVCWVDGRVGGVEFEKPLHPAVFQQLIERLAMKGPTPPAGGDAAL